MLKEFAGVKQEEAGRCRRWFEDDGMELIVWYGAAGAVDGFQILYGRGDTEHALTWRSVGGFAHSRVDQGDNLFSKRSPILVPNGTVPWTRVRAEFTTRSTALAPPLREFVLAQLARNSAHGP